MRCWRCASDELALPAHSRVAVILNTIILLSVLPLQLDNHLTSKFNVLMLFVKWWGRKKKLRK